MKEYLLKTTYNKSVNVLDHNQQEFILKIMAVAVISRFAILCIILILLVSVSINVELTIYAMD